MKHTRGIDVARSGAAALTLLAAEDTHGLLVWANATVNRANAYRAADEAFTAATEGLEPTHEAYVAASAARLLALRQATREYDAVLAILADADREPETLASAIAAALGE